MGRKMRIPMAFGEYDGLPKAQNGVGDPAILVDKEDRNYLDCRCLDTWYGKWACVVEFTNRHGP